MISYDAIKDFDQYVEYYPAFDQPGYDGVHDGGIKGLKPGAPDKAVQAYAKYVEMIETAKNRGIML